MEMMIENEDFLTNYLGLLNSLSRESKIKLVENLSLDIKNSNISQTDWIDKLYGSFISDKPAEAIISELRSNKQFSREVTSF
jgi:phosphopantetheine adenylyltransferase